MDQGSNNLKTIGQRLRAPFSSRYALLGAAGVLAAAGGLVYLYWEQLNSAYISTQDAVLATLGLGVAPVALWLVVFLWALTSKRSWFGRINLWAGSLVFLAFILGVMAFFQPSSGALTRFTPDSDVTLGGRVGYAVAGPVVWQGILRVLAVFVVGAFITAPSLTVDLARGLGKGFVFIYVFSVVAIKGLMSALRHMYRFQPESRFEPKQTDGVEETLTPTAGPSARSRVNPAPVPRRNADDLASRAPAVLSAAKSRADNLPTLARQADEEPGPDRDMIHQPTPDKQLVSGVPALQSNAELQVFAPPASEEELRPDKGAIQERKPGIFPATSDEEESEHALPAEGRFNKFWHTTTADQDKPQDPVSEDSDQDDVSTDPVLEELAASWQRPEIDLLVDAPEGGISKEEMIETGETIKRTLAEYNVEVEIGDIKPGPTVTMYGLVPGWVRRHKQVKVTDEHGEPKRDESGKPAVARVETKTRVKVDSIMSREKDLALALKTRSIRIETPAMGKSLVGIEVPNPTPNLVTLRGVMESEEFKKLRASAALPIALGKGTGGETVVLDLAKMPHLLIAGATGSGKSVCINTVVSCLIKEKTPAEMRLLLVDPKRVELTPYNGIPHLLTKVVVETDQVVALLKGMIREMLGRYRLMEEQGVKNIEAYNKKMPEEMPYLVVAIDELADLMMTASFDVEQSLCRLAQLGRATGIHLIIATQRPSVDVVTGLIKANFPSRISFGVSSQIDSRTILDSVGAEKLLGRGDMLYLGVDSSRPERVQGVFISDREIERLVEFWQTTPRASVPAVSLHAVGDGDADEDAAETDDRPADRDEFLDKAVELAEHYNKLSTSLLQRRMRIGYPRAARLMDQLEEAGIVGPGDGSKSRDVIMNQV